MTEQASIAIQLKNVVVQFASTALQFDCTFERGTVTAVTGPSGSGKSTLFNIIAGFEAPALGNVEIDGKDMADVDPADRPVSIIFQEHNLFSHLDVATNIGLGINPSLKLTPADKERVGAALDRVRLAGFEKRLPGTLSGGERQRVAIARALVRRKPVLLLDEPFAALDPGLRAEMRELLVDLHRKEVATILIITHHPDDVAALADSVIFLQSGRIVVHEASERFLERRDSAEINAFFGR